MADISTLTDVNGNTHNIKDATARERLVPTGGSAGQVLTAGANGTRTWEDPAGTVDTVNGISPDANKNVETAKDVTTSEYEALPSTKTSDNKDYYLTDGEPSVATANDIPYTSTQSVKGALDDLNNGLTWKYAGGTVGAGFVDISSLDYDELFIQVDINQSGNKGTFQIPKMILTASTNWFRTGGYVNANSNELVTISATLSRVTLVNATINGQDYLSNSRMFVYYR